ncbi:MAG: endonuclease/exonuclease/phosphatase family protein [Phycisphaerales bacterium JB040]
MTHSSGRGFGIRTLAAGAVVFGLLSGCHAAGPVRVDGDTSEWSGSEYARVDAEWVYLRLAPDGPPATLQGSELETRIWFDTDSDPATGLETEAGGETLGAEFGVVLSPRRENGEAGYGTSVLAYGGAGRAREIGHAGLGLHFSPTYASPEYEVRVSREKLGLGEGDELTVVMARGDWSRRVRVVGTEPGGEGAGWAGGADASWLDERAGWVRVMSWNVERGGPEANPMPFSRVLRALEPEVVLVQEWWDADGATIERWLKRYGAIENSRWEAVAYADGGVSVLTRLPIVLRLDEPVGLPGERDVRFVGAVVESGSGPMLVGSVHLKCCGSLGSEEDLRRVREAEAIAAYIVSVIDRVGVRTVVIGGDFNLVGSRPPLETLMTGLDVDGSDLALADPGHLRDHAVYTWRDGNSDFSPGHLDYVLVGDAESAIRRAFVLDTTTLDAPTLERYGLEASDSTASDHLAVVVDVEVCPGGCE